MNSCFGTPMSQILMGLLTADHVSFEIRFSPTFQTTLSNDQLVHTALYKASQSLCANHGCSSASRAVILLVGSNVVILQTSSRNCASTKYHLSNGFRGFDESKLPARVTRRSKNGFFSPIHCSKPLKPSSSPKKDICRRRMYRHESLAANSSSLARRTMSFSIT